MCVILCMITEPVAVSDLMLKLWEQEGRVYGL